MTDGSESDRTNRTSTITDEGSDSRRLTTRDRRAFLAALGGGSATAMAGCLESFGGGGGSTPDSVDIGMTGPQSGWAASLATSFIGGVKAWVEFQDGQYKDATINLDIRDNQSEADRASRVSSQFVQNNKDIVISAFVTSLTRAAAPPCEQAGVPHLSLGSALPALHQEFDTLVQSLTPQYRDDTVDLVATNDNIESKKVAAWSVDGDVMRYAHETMLNRIEEHDNLELVYETLHPFDQEDYSSMALKAENNGADVLLMANYIQHFIPSMRGVEESAWEPEFVSNVIGGTSQAYQQLGQTLEGTVIDSTWHPSMDTPQTEEFEQYFNQVTPSGVLADYQGATGWAAMQVLAKAFDEEIDVTDSDAFLEWLHEASVETVSGTWEVDDGGVQTGIGWKLTQWQGTNQPIVYPEEYKIADVIYPKPWS